MLFVWPRNQNLDFVMFRLIYFGTCQCILSLFKFNHHSWAPFFFVNHENWSNGVIYNFVLGHFTGFGNS
jgi:hypothetical protein